MNMGLAQRLREGTRALHTRAEQAGVMPELLRGSLPAATFWRLQRSLLSVYESLERGLARHAAHPQLAPLALAGLPRTASLHDDLQALAGPGWQQALPVCPAAQAYAERLAELADHQAPLLAAHAYVRYLGDLAGGQALRRVVQRAYGLPDGVGTRFFDFGPADRVARLGQQFRQALDALPLDDAGRQALVTEACWAFEQHVRLFDELAAAPA